jgi:hypothetical protein
MLSKLCLFQLDDLGTQMYLSGCQRPHLESGHTLHMLCIPPARSVGDFGIQELHLVIIFKLLLVKRNERTCWW